MILNREILDQLEEAGIGEDEWKKANLVVKVATITAVARAQSTKAQETQNTILERIARALEGDSSSNLARLRA